MCGRSWLSLPCVSLHMCLSVSVCSVFLYCPVTFFGVRTSWFKTCAPPLGDLNPFGSARSPQRDQTKPPSVPLWEPKCLLVSLFDSELKGQGWFLCGGGERPGLSSRASCPLLRLCKQVSVPSAPCLLQAAPGKGESSPGLSQKEKRKFLLFLLHNVCLLLN